VKVSTCRGCQTAIHWIKTMAGRQMPVDVDKWYVHPEGTGQVVTIVTSEGKMVTAPVVSVLTPGATTGYRPHWATCPKAKEFTRKKQETKA